MKDVSTAGTGLLSAAPARVWPYIVAILLLPLLVLWRDDSVLFGPPWNTDAWFYLGYFRSLVNFERELFPEMYYGSRLSWILPGSLAHSLFSPFLANILLHLTVHSVATLSLFSTLRLVSGVRAAFLTSMVFSVHPWLWAAIGWDYIDGPGIAYCLLATFLLTRAALQTHRKWLLLLAGVALAAMVDSNFFWSALFWLLPLYCVALISLRHRIPILRSLREVGVWTGAGFLLTIAAFSALFYWWNGSWLWAASLTNARKVSGNWPWHENIWREVGLAPWLWFGAAALTAALFLLPARLKRPATLPDSIGLLFSAQLLLVSALMGYMQHRGMSVLGQYSYAIYLLPFVFLVIGTSFWPFVEQMSTGQYLLTCGAAALVLASIWYDPLGTFIAKWAAPSIPAFLICVGLLVASLLLRGRILGPPMAVAGFAAMTALILPATASLHGSAAQYTRVMNARDRVEALRAGGLVRFWFDDRDPGYYNSDYFALNSTYLAEFSRLGTSFPQDGCNAPVDPGTLIVAASKDPRTPEVAATALAACWRPFGMKPILEGTLTPGPIDRPYTVAMIRAATDDALSRPLQITPDKSDKKSLEPSQSPVALPREGWALVPYPVDPAAIRMTPAGPEVRTPPGAFAFALTYAPLTAPATGRYRLSLKYRRGTGQFAFGARDAADSRYLAADAVGHPIGGGREMILWLNLQQGETFLLRIANNNNFGDGAATFVMGDVTAFQIVSPPLADK